MNPVSMSTTLSDSLMISYVIVPLQFIIIIPIQILIMGQEESVEEIIKFTIPYQRINRKAISALTDTTLGYIDLSQGKWHENNLSEVMPFVKEWNIRKGIIFDKNENPTILKEISNISFNFLIELSLRRNNIESIEPICRILFPNLERLWFCDNKITKIGCFRKAHTPNLRYLSFNTNEMTDLKVFSEHDSPFLDQLFIMILHEKIHTLSCTAKFRTKNLHRIYSQEFTEKEKKIIKKKYPNVIFTQEGCFPAA